MRQSVRLGLMAPLTGLVDIYGPEIVRAAQIACQEINEAGGVLGKTLELVVEDDGSLPATAVPAGKKLIAELGCVALIGNLLSNSRIAVVEQVAESEQIPLLNFSFYEGSISSRYFFHFAALPNQQIDKMIPLMAKRYGPKMYFAGNNYEWPRGSIDAAKRALAKAQGDVVGEDYLPIGAKNSEIDALLHNVGRSGADVFVPYFAGTDQVKLLTRFFELGLKRRMAVVMGHCDEMMVSLLPPSVRQDLYSTNTYFMTLPTPENQALLQRISAYPGVQGLWPDGNGVLTNFGEGAYLCVHAFAKAAEMAGTTHGEALVRALEQVKLKGPQGNIAMDPATHHASVNTYLTRCNERGTFHVVESFGCIAPEIPVRHRLGKQILGRQAAAATPRTTARLATETAAARRNLATAQQILSVADVAIIATDCDGFIREINRRACQLFGYAEGELVGQPVHVVLPPHLRDSHDLWRQQFIADRAQESGFAVRSSISGYRKDGSFFPVDVSIAKCYCESEMFLVFSMNDISVRMHVEEELIRRATHDPLTGLANRTLIQERLQAALERSLRGDLGIAVLYVDLDGFKPLNDTQGHEVGDQVLKAVSARLLEQVRPGDTVARLAGDEFVILCEQLEDSEPVQRLAARLTANLREAFTCPEGPVFLTASIGIACGDGRHNGADQLLRQADTAMYAVKQKGGDAWQMFSEGLQAQAAQRLAITAGLRMALERQEMSTRFQPILHAETGEIVGAELLLRWHPSGREVSPATFIPIAENSGSIVPIGQWVFQQACQAEADWRRRWGAKAPYVAVNVSTRQLNDASVVSAFGAALQQSSADPARILLEITETALMADVETNIRVLRQLADMGLRVAVDDFGTGYSSLAQLSRMPVNVLKVDRAFVDGIDASPENRAIIRAVIGLGRALGLKMVGEGVETADQHQVLCAYGCDLVQGYHFYRPMMPAQFIAAVDAKIQAQRAAPLDNGLYFLIYVSQAVRPVTQSDLAELHERIEHFNRNVGISGCLLHDAGYYMQMLEGQKAAVCTLMEKIRRDPRHQDVRVVVEGPAQRRVFHGLDISLKDLTAHAVVSPEEQTHRRISLHDLALDPITAYHHIAAHASSRDAKDAAGLTAVARNRS